ncbi:MAG: competence/damage-inducible protein A [Solirubrobacteraceae bacterium MAG38_C4-C5]|nr:competence/damage-inducible protein A [Candidatus Siliceabacter maunaloa]
MSARAAILVTGTEVLTGRVSDRNGPWLADRLLELGVDVAQTAIVADRPQELLATLRFLADQGVDMVITSGGLGPTADDLTAEVVAAFQERPLMLDEALEGRIAEILRPLALRFPDLDVDAVRAGNAKQALVPRGATVLEPVGTAPGLVVPPPEGSPGGPTVVVLPGPPRELQPMWGDAVVKDAFRAATAGAGDLRQRTLRLFGLPESEIAATLRQAVADGVALERLEVTTCLRRGEVEVVTRFEPPAQSVHDALADVVRTRHADTLFSDDGRSVDAMVLDALRGPPARRIAVAESCTGGLLAARLTERAGSSEVVAGGLVVYANEAKVSLAGVDPGLIASFGAVSVEVARALASGACDRFGADVGVGVTGVAGPTGGTEDKPVGTVCLSAVLADGGGALTHRVTLPGARFDVRDRSTTVALHLVRRLLAGERD